MTNKYKKALNKLKGYKGEEAAKLKGEDKETKKIAQKFKRKSRCKKKM